MQENYKITRSPVPLPSSIVDFRLSKSVVTVVLTDDEGKFLTESSQYFYVVEPMDGRPFIITDCVTDYMAIGMVQQLQNEANAQRAASVQASATAAIPKPPS